MKMFKHCVDCMERFVPKFDNQLFCSDVCQKLCALRMKRKHDRIMAENLKSEIEIQQILGFDYKKLREE